MVTFKFLTRIFVILPALAVTACATGVNDPRASGMTPATYSALRNAEAGIKLGREISKLLQCNGDQVQTETQSTTQVASGSDFQYDSQRDNRFRGRSGSNSNRGPVRERAFSEVENEASFRCETTNASR